MLAGVVSVEQLLAPGPTRVMGILNVTPDSFAEVTAREARQAIDWGIELAEQGADVVDVGGVSTRPGASPVDCDEEMARVLPVVEALAGAGIAVSVDTVRALVARAAVGAGAVFVNDVSGGLADPEILSVVAGSSAGFVLQHWRVPFDHSLTHADVVAEVRAELSHRAGLALEAGIPPTRLVVDPGIGFGKSPTQNWTLLASADAIATLGFPVLWGVSRKRFLSQMYSRPTDPWERDVASVAATALLAAKGVWAVRTHTVEDHLTAIRVAEAVRGGGRS